MVVIGEREVFFDEPKKFRGAHEFLKAKKDIVRDYLRVGSVDQLVKDGCSMSFQSIHRLLDQWGIVKNPPFSPSTSYSAIVEYFRMLSMYPTSIGQVQSYFWREGIFTNSPGFNISESALNSVQRNVLNGEITKKAIGLIITCEDDPKKVLIGQDLSFHRVRNGVVEHPLTAPVCSSSIHEDPSQAIIRLLQQEVFTDLAVEGGFIPTFSLRERLLQGISKPAVRVFVLDRAVDVYTIKLQGELLMQMGGGSLENLTFVDVDNLISSSQDFLHSKYRPGVVELATVYKSLLKCGNEDNTTIEVTSELNRMFRANTKGRSKVKVFNQF